MPSLVVINESEDIVLTICQGHVNEGSCGIIIGNPLWLVIILSTLVAIDIMIVEIFLSLPRNLTRPRDKKAM